MSYTMMVKRIILTKYYDVLHVHVHVVHAHDVESEHDITYHIMPHVIVKLVEK